MTEATSSTEMRTILVGLDDSPAGRRALEWAAARAKESDADLVVVHVLTYSRELANDVSIPGLTTWRRRLVADVAGPWTEPARSIGVTVKTAVVEDDTAAAGLLGAAEREHADLIVIGAHGQGSVFGRLLGATAYRISHRARVPVVIVPVAGER